MMGRNWKFVLVLFVCMLGLVVQAETILTTADGNGADTWVVNDARASGNKGTSTTIEIRQYADTRCRIMYLKFDISNLTSLSGALLEIQNFDKTTGSVVPFSVYGVIDDATDDAWGETTITYENAPGMLPATDGNYALDSSKLTYLGTITYPGGGYAGVITSNTTDLNLDSFFAADTNGLVTLVILDEGLTTKEFYFASKERAEADENYIAPRLLIPEPSLLPVYPELGQTDVEQNVTLQWTGLPDEVNPQQLDPNVVAHCVYIDYDNTDTDPNLIYEDTITVTNWSDPNASYGPLSLNLDDSISWQIEEIMDTGSGAAGDPNNIFGPIWSFTTLKSVPVVSQDQPVSVRVFPAESAELNVDFTSISTPTVKWYKDDNTTVTEITTGITTTDNGGGNYTTTLELATPLDASDEGQYYCSVSNDGENWFDSGIADVVVKRQLAQYDFDSSLADSSANGAPTGTALDSLGDPNTATHVAGTINYVNGADGTANGAIYLDPNEYVNFGTDGYPKANAATTNGFGGGMDEGTIVYWIKLNNTDADQTILANFNAVDSTGFQSQIQSDDDLRLYSRDAGGKSHQAQGRSDRPEYDPADGQWHMMATCYSGGTSKLYVDGQWVAEGSGTAPTSFGQWQYGVLLGATRSSSNRTFIGGVLDGGVIDNLRIYNYRLDDAGNDVFAQEYLDNTGIHPCVNMDFLNGMVNTNYDNTGSSYCVVNLADFAAFAETWLESGLY